MALTLDFLATVVAAAGVAFLCTVGWVILWGLTGLQLGCARLSQELLQGD